MANNTKKNVNNLVSNNTVADIAAAFKVAGKTAPTKEAIEEKAAKARSNANNSYRVLPVGVELTVANSNVVSIEVMDNGNYWFAVNCEGGRKVNLARLCRQSFAGYGFEDVQQTLDKVNKDIVKATATDHNGFNEATVVGRFPDFIDVFDAYEKIKANPALVAGQTLVYKGILTKKFVAKKAFKAFGASGKQDIEVKEGDIRAMTIQWWA